MSIIKKIFLKPLEQQSEYINKLKKDKIIIQPNEYITYITSFDKKLTLYIIDHLVFIKQLSSLLNKQSIESIFNQL